MLSRCNLNYLNIWTAFMGPAVEKHDDKLSILPAVICFFVSRKPGYWRCQSKVPSGS